MDEKFIELLRQNFYQKLELKTGWGRNEIKTTFEAAILKSVLEYASKK